MRPPIGRRHTGQGGVGVGRQRAGGAEQAAATEVHQARDPHTEARAQQGLDLPDAEPEYIFYICTYILYTYLTTYTVIKVM